MKCTIQTVMVCNDPSTCVRGMAAAVNLPPILTVDVPNKVIKVISGAATAEWCGSSPSIAVRAR